MAWHYCPHRDSDYSDIEFDSDEEEFSEGDGYEYVEDEEDDDWGTAPTAGARATAQSGSDASGTKIAVGVVAPDPSDDAEYELYPDEPAEKPVTRRKPLSDVKTLKSKQAVAKVEVEPPEPEIGIKIASVFSLQPKPTKPAPARAQPQLTGRPRHPIGRLVGYRVESRPEGDVIVPDPSFSAPKPKTEPKSKKATTAGRERIQPQPQPPKLTEQPTKKKKPTATGLEQIHSQPSKYTTQPEPPATSTHEPERPEPTPKTEAGETSVPESTPVATATATTTPTSEAESEASSDGSGYARAGNSPNSKSDFRCPFCPKVFKLRMLANHHIYKWHREEANGTNGALAVGGFETEAKALKPQLPEIERRDLPLTSPVLPQETSKLNPTTITASVSDEKPHGHQKRPNSATAGSDAEGRDCKMPVLHPEVDFTKAGAGNDDKAKARQPTATLTPIPTSTSLTNNATPPGQVGDEDEVVGVKAESKSPENNNEGSGTGRQLRKRTATKPGRVRQNCSCCEDSDKAQHEHHGPKKPKIGATVFTQTQGPNPSNTRKEKKHPEPEPPRRKGKSEPTKPKLPKGRPNSLQRYSLEDLASVMGSGASGGGHVLVGNRSATAANGLGAQARASCPQLQPLVQVLGPGPPMLTLVMGGNGNQKESQFKAEAKKKKSRPRSRPRPRPRARSLADVNDNANGAWKCLQCDRVYEKQQSLAAHTQSHYREQAKKGIQKGGMNSYMHLQAEGSASEN